jgi:RimJ/RimL family protein N-acetyltransferase
MHVFLETERLVLRRFTEDDIDNLVELDGDPDVMYFINGGRPTPRDMMRNKILPMFLGYYDRYEGFGFWAAIERSSGEFLGWLCLRPEDNNKIPNNLGLGYRLRKSVWGKGYATEGARALIHKGFRRVRRAARVCQDVRAERCIPPSDGEGWLEAGADISILGHGSRSRRHMRQLVPGPLRGERCRICCGESRMGKRGREVEVPR